MIEIDGGEGKNYNETFTFQGHQWLAIDKQEGIFVGGKPEFTGIKSFEVNSDYQNSCIDDIRWVDWKEEKRKMPLELTNDFSGNLSLEFQAPLWLFKSKC